MFGLPAPEAVIFLYLTAEEAELRGWYMVERTNVSDSDLLVSGLRQIVDDFFPLYFDIMSCIAGQGSFFTLLCKVTHYRCRHTLNRSSSFISTFPSVSRRLKCLVRFESLGNRHGSFTPSVVDAKIQRLQYHIRFESLGNRHCTFRPYSVVPKRQRVQ